MPKNEREIAPELKELLRRHREIQETAEVMKSCLDELIVELLEQFPGEEKALHGILEGRAQYLLSLSHQRKKGTNGVQQQGHETVPTGSRGVQKRNGASGNVGREDEGSP